MEFLKRYTLKDILLQIIGVFIMGFGVGMLIKTGYGADTSNALFTGISNISNLSVGTINSVAAVVMIVIVFFLSRKRIVLGTLLVPFLVGFPIDLAISIWFKAPNLLSGIIIDIISLYIVSFGAAITIEFELGPSPYDCMALGISDFFKIKFVFAKYILDGFCVLVGFLLKGEIGVGTLLCFLVMGIFISINRKILRNIANKISAS